MQIDPKLERLTFFSDAVFAIAMTLLVIEIRVPHLHAGDGERELIAGLLGLVPNYVGFVVSFLVIARFWIGHHRLMGMVVATDARLVRRNFALLMAIAFMPFPTAVLSDYTMLRTAVGFYAAYLALVGLANLALVRAALATGLTLQPGAASETAAMLRRAMVPLMVGAGAFAAAMIRPTLGIVVLTIGAPLAMWLASRRERRQLAAAGRGPDQAG